MEMQKLKQSVYQWRKKKRKKLVHSRAIFSCSNKSWAVYLEVISRHDSYSIQAALLMPMLQAMWPIGSLQAVPELWAEGLPCLVSGQTGQAG